MDGEGLPVEINAQVLRAHMRVADDDVVVVAAPDIRGEAFDGAVRDAAVAGVAG